MFILPALFHLILKKKDLKLYHYIFDILILIFGVYVGVVGLLYTGKSLFKTIFHDNWFYNGQSSTINSPFLHCREPRHRLEAAT